MDNQTQVSSSGSSASKFVLPAVVAALIVFAAIGFYLYKNNSAAPASITGTSEKTKLETDSFAPSAKTSYKDGTYKSTGKYITPGGERQIDVKLTLSRGSITDITVTPTAEDATSQRFQGEFANNYKGMVIGKNIDEVVLTKVSGSSLTPKGFTNALEQIKLEAKS